MGNYDLNPNLVRFLCIDILVKIIILKLLSYASWLKKKSLLDSGISFPYSGTNEQVSPILASYILIYSFHLNPNQYFLGMEYSLLIIQVGLIYDATNEEGLLQI